MRCFGKSCSQRSQKIGDIVGSAYEFSNFKGKEFAPLFHSKTRFTDDTVCTVAVADALIRGSDPQATLIDWCKRYAENGGWGKRFSLGGDSDTIAAIAGGISESLHGIPNHITVQALTYLPPDMKAVMNLIYIEASPGQVPGKSA